jgi:hypothetical protein
LANDCESAETQKPEEYSTAMKKTIVSLFVVIVLSVAHGRDVYIGFEGSASSLGNGPYFAY